MEQKSSSTTLTGSDGQALFCRRWLPAQTSTAVVALVHGLGEHSGRYEHVARYFTAQNYAVFAIDLHGHGQSAGPRGHVSSFQNYFDDVSALLTYARKETQALPVFLLGHSLGGLIVLAYTLKYPAGLSAVIASAPALQDRTPLPGWKVALSKILSGVWPALALGNGLALSGLSRDQRVVEAYKADPLVHDRVTTLWAAEFMAVRRWAMQSAHTMTAPTLILHGEADPIIAPAGSREFFDRIPLADKRYIEYSALYHEIFNEPEQLTVLKDVQTWIKAHLL